MQGAYKLILNGNYGKLNETTNWQYSPFTAMCVTIGCQIDILMLIELLETNGISVISANTDGIVCLMKKSQESLYMKLCEEWEKIVGNDVLGKLEFQDYVLLAQTSVNDYIAITKEGKIKEKGDFEVVKQLHKNNGASIIPLSIEKYFVDGIDYKTFIHSHNKIEDFCMAIKGKRNFKTVLHKIVKGEYTKKEGQKITRYYVSTDGGTLVKEYNDGRIINAESECKCTFANILPDVFPSNVNYKYYIEQVEKILFSIEQNSKQLNLF